VYILIKQNKACGGKMKKILIAIAIIVVIAIIMWDMSSGGTPVKTAQARKGKISAYIEDRAKTSLPIVYHITMPQPGRILPITIQSGTKVEKAQIVAKMDSADLETVIKETHAKMEATKKRIAREKYNAIEETAFKESSDWIKTMEATVAASWKKAEASKARNGFAQWYLKSAKEMKQAISVKELNKAQMEAAEAEVNYEADLLQYSAIKTVSTIFKLCPVYIKQFLDRKKLTVDILESELKNAQASLEKAQRDLARGTMKSPVNGIVLKRYIKNERALEAGAKLLDIGDMNNLEITADILSQEAVAIQAGDPVDIYGPALGDKSLPGKVIRVKPEGFTKISSLGVEQQRAPVIISIDEKAKEELAKSKLKLGVGYRIQVRIHTAEADNAIIIPRTALFMGSDGKWKVFAADGSTAKLTEVEIGLMNDMDAQVLKGLKPEDKVILAPPASLVSGASIVCSAP
jgi:HlyD family secretion protein